jgi:hypothetical protein
MDTACDGNTPVVCASSVKRFICYWNLLQISLSVSHLIFSTEKLFVNIFQAARQSIARHNYSSMEEEPMYQFLHAEADRLISS